MSASCRLRAKYYPIITTILVSSCLTVVPIASAQVSSDGTVQTQVTPTENQLHITGGTQAGTNLFHSFSQFSVPRNLEAYFDNSSTINNIISRVTGGSLSNIEGKIRANGTANLFLINPNGIVFGPNAAIDIGGSFLASTAESIVFADGSQFSATNPQSPPVLTMTVPVGLQFGSKPGTIINQANRTVPDSTSPNPDNTRQVGLEVKDGNTLALVGGELNFPGGNLTVARGRVELGSVGDNSFVQLTAINSGFQLGYQGVSNFQDISISQGSLITGDNSEIQTQGRNIRIIEGSQISSTTENSQDAGDLTVNASELLEIIGSKTSGFPSGLYAQVRINASGNGGNILIHTKNLIIRNGGVITGDTFSSGTGGTLEIHALESVELIGTGFAVPSLLTTSTSGTGNGGSMMINTRQLRLQNGAQIVVFTARNVGNGGTININASELVQVSGQGRVPDLDREVPSRITAESGFQDRAIAGIGLGGNLSINTNQLIVTNGGSITAGSVGTGNAGNLNINANSIFLDNQGQITASSEGTGDAGNVNINTDQLIVNNKSEIAVRNIGFGGGGNLNINANAISLNQDSQLTAASQTLEDASIKELGINPRQFANLPNIGNAGNLTLNTSSLNLNNDSQITVSSFGTGNAGNIDITAQNITLDNSSELTAETASGEGGNISLYVSDFLTLRRASTISTTAGTEGGGGNGGNIDINAQFIIAVPTEN
ncbi:MAG TPA: filamentous hemagglutinin, partial [Cyanothece sp. UBA12306]|nr:filamentous hemagglutinin [Cyanothece sp. UBA12306]